MATFRHSCSLFFASSAWNFFFAATVIFEFNLLESMTAVNPFKFPNANHDRQM
jgi:hypothetical protein